MIFAKGSKSTEGTHLLFNYWFLTLYGERRRSPRPLSPPPPTSRSSRKGQAQGPHGEGTNPFSRRKRKKTPRPADTPHRSVDIWHSSLCWPEYCRDARIQSWRLKTKGGNTGRNDKLLLTVQIILDEMDWFGAARCASLKILKSKYEEGTHSRFRFRCVKFGFVKKSVIIPVVYFEATRGGLFKFLKINFPILV